MGTYAKLTFPLKAPLWIVFSKSDFNASRRHRVKNSTFTSSAHYLRRAPHRNALDGILSWYVTYLFTVSVSLRLMAGTFLPELPFVVFDKNATMPMHPMENCSASINLIWRLFNPRLIKLLVDQSYLIPLNIAECAVKVDHFFLPTPKKKSLKKLIFVCNL